MSALKILVLVALILYLAPDCAEGMPVNFTPCCTELAKRIPKNMLHRVTKVQFQRKDGVCILRAIVLHINNKQICMDPNNRSLQRWIKKNLPSKAL